MASRTHSANYVNYMQSAAWRLHARSCLRLTRGRCALIPLLPAIEAHHLHYGHLRSEWVIIDTVPLSRFAHSLVHLPLLESKPIRFMVNGWLRISTIVVSLLSRPLLAAFLCLAIWSLAQHPQWAL